MKILADRGVRPPRDRSPGDTFASHHSNAVGSRSALPENESDIERQ